METGSVLKKWCALYWEECAHLVDSVERKPLEVEPGVFLLEPTVAALIMADGLWASVNRACGTIFDLAETDRAGPEELSCMATAIERFANDRYASARLVKTPIAIEVSDGIERTLFVELEADTIRGTLRELSAFLSRAAAAGKRVVVTL